MDAADGLIKPCPNRYRVVPVHDWAVNLGVSPHLCFYYLRDCLPNTQYHCSVNRCTDTFTETEIGNHLKAKHYGIARNPERVTCKECRRTMRAKSYHDHFLQIHRGRSIRCAYCTTRQVRVQNFPGHFKACPGLNKYRKGQKALRPTYVFRSYLPPSSSPHLSVSNPYPSDGQERSTSNDGGRDDTSFSSSPLSDLDDSMGAENSSVGGNSRIATNCAQSDLYSRTDHILDSDNANALHALLGSIPPPDDASPLALGTISSRHPSVTEKLLKPCPEGYREVRDDSIQTWRGRPLPGLLVYYLRDPPAIAHSCPVDGCTSQFSGDGIRAHLRAEHPGITSQLFLKCKECDPKVSCIVAKSYATHFLDRHSGHSILCAYCLTSQSRAKNLPRHLLNHCSGLRHYSKKRRAAA
ncbi:hypothetical protein ARMSODRAFT_767059 [Armillaria solidipes]|uniref:C2H2-type domain-containing protein n=1 Tax=Armillaria solidipes TaxID=1076256 RepID=A0A2H3ALY9_9AGAR|nr:hypothetical protein ARMSODRAFT_767059 [Armillaria solidipes]